MMVEIRITIQAGQLLKEGTLRLVAAVNISREIRKTKYLPRDEVLGGKEIDGTTKKHSSKI